MHNPLVLSLNNIVRGVLGANTNSGQAGLGLWVSRAQAARLSPTPQPAQNSLWVNTTAFAQQSLAPYTTFPTAKISTITLLVSLLSPQSTNPIKTITKYIKESRY